MNVREHRLRTFLLMAARSRYLPPPKPELL
jgi:hypothetical protein